MAAKQDSKRKRIIDGDTVTVRAKNANGAGSVFWDSHRRRWVASWINETTGRRQKRQGRTQDEARERMAEARNNPAPVGPAPLFGQMAEEWLDRRINRPAFDETPLRPTTADDYSKRVARLCRSSLASVRVDEVACVAIGLFLLFDATGNLLVSVATHFLVDVAILWMLLV